LRLFGPLVASLAGESGAIWLFLLLRFCIVIQSLFNAQRTRNRESRPGAFSPQRQQSKAAPQVVDNFAPNLKK
jgi:hypothetical protein